jgi:hypothetical protein
MSSSQIQCHLDAIYDTKMRIKDLSTTRELLLLLPPSPPPPPPTD